MSRTLSAVMSRLMRGPLGFLAGWAERGLLAIGVLLRLFQSSGLLSSRYGGFMPHIQGKLPEKPKVSSNLYKLAKARFAELFWNIAPKFGLARLQFLSIHRSAQSRLLEPWHRPAAYASL